MPAPARPFRFGVQLPYAPDRATWVAKARQAEDLGYATLLMPDHFGEQLAPTPALMAAADATTTLRVGTLVYDNDYRHPLVLAKEAATLDVLSDGRFELGLGAGWMRTDYDDSGIAYDEPRVRVDRFEEGLRVVKGLLSRDRTTVTGVHYRVDHDGTPKPVQDRVPILVGGGGRRVLSIAAREADIVGVNPNLREGAVGVDAVRSATAEETDRKLAWVRAAAGDRFDDLELTCSIFLSAVTEDPHGTAAAVGGGFGLTPEEALEVPIALVGTIDAMVEALVARRERWGFSYIVFAGADMETLAPIVAKLAGT